jgi:hypothetical protein
MIRIMCKALTVAAGLAVLASVAMAGVPDATMSTTDGDLMIANARGLYVLALPNVKTTVTNGYQVTVRDVGGSPLAGVTVSMNLTGTGLRAHSTQANVPTVPVRTQTAPNCGTLNVVQAVTDAAGLAILVPACVGVNSSTAPNVQIRANGILLTTIRMPSLDLSCLGTPGKVEGYDLNAFRTRFLNLPAGSNTDPACDYATLDSPVGGFAVNGFDLNVFRTEYLCGNPGAPVPAPCTQTQCATCP